MFSTHSWKPPGGHHANISSQEPWKNKLSMCRQEHHIKLYTSRMVKTPEKCLMDILRAFERQRRQRKRMPQMLAPPTTFKSKKR
jgi:hypothetical protein